MKKEFEFITEDYRPNLMNKYYLVHSGIKQFVWFMDYESAFNYLLSPWVDSRFAREVITPITY